MIRFDAEQVQSLELLENADLILRDRQADRLKKLLHSPVLCAWGNEYCCKPHLHFMDRNVLYPIEVDTVLEAHKLPLHKYSCFNASVL